MLTLVSRSHSSLMGGEIWKHTDWAATWWRSHFLGAHQTFLVSSSLDAHQDAHLCIQIPLALMGGRIWMRARPSPTASSGCSPLYPDPSCPHGRMDLDAHPAATQCVHISLTWPLPHIAIWLTWLQWRWARLASCHTTALTCYQPASQSTHTVITLTPPNTVTCITNTALTANTHGEHSASLNTTSMSLPQPQIGRGL